MYVTDVQYTCIYTSGFAHVFLIHMGLAQARPNYCAYLRIHVHVHDCILHAVVALTIVPRI